MVSTSDAPLFAGIRRNSLDCLERFELLRGLEGMAAAMVVVKPLQAGQPVEIQVVMNVDLLDLGPSLYQRPDPQPARKR